MKLFQFKMWAAALAVLLISGIAISQDSGSAAPPPGPGMRHHHHGEFGGPFGFYAKALNLTDAQKAQIKQILAAEKPTIRPLMQQEGQSRVQMMQLATSGNFDETKAQAIAAQEAQTHTQLEVEHAKIISQAYQILTPDQKTKFADIQGKMQQRMERHEQHEEAPPVSNQ